MKLEDVFMLMPDRTVGFGTIETEGEAISKVKLSNRLSTRPCALTTEGGGMLGVSICSRSGSGSTSFGAVGSGGSGSSAFSTSGGFSSRGFSGSTSGAAGIAGETAAVSSSSSAKERSTLERSRVAMAVGPGAYFI